MVSNENYDSESDEEEPKFEKITINIDYKIKTSLEEPPTDLELKPLPDNLEYVFLEEPCFLPVIISSQLFGQNKSKLVSGTGLEVDKAKNQVGAVLEFDIEIKDKKGTENVAAYHLSQIDNNKSSDDSEVDDNLPGETLLEVNTRNEPCHDVCFLDFVNDVNMHAKSKSKSKKSQVQNIWKPTGKVFTDVGLKWKPVGRLFTIVGNSCPLTRLTPNKIVPLKENTYNSVETPKPEIKVYSRRPKKIKSVGSSRKAKIVESKIANNSEPSHLWGSNAIDVPSSSSLVNDRLSRLFSGIRTLNVQNI
ncbi:hypothetical protein Tco_1166522 [Tanacetum coccineum]